MNISETPVLLLTGYLGSGKTTLVNKILSNKKGIKFAVIVNDIGEVNIDADLIQKGGVVDKKDDSLVALQNGCICCTLKMDLVEQLHDIVAQHRFDYIVIEASGVCEPAPIAQTICSIPNMEAKYVKDGIPVLDCVVTVVDALRMKDEFGSGDNLVNSNIEEDDIENLVIQQIEFCNIILLNKASEVEPKELERIRQIIRTLQPKAEIIDCDYGEVELDKIISTKKFNINSVASSAAWMEELDKHIDEMDEDDDDDEEHEHHHHHDDEDEHEHHHHHHHDDDDDDDEEHEHHHHHDHPEGCTCGHCHHHHHHGEGETEEYGIGTFVYYRREPFDLVKFDEFVGMNWPKGIIRTKGLCYFYDEQEMCYIFEQAGKQVKISKAGQWYATMPKDELDRLMAAEPGLRRDWDEKYGDRMQKIVFIGQKLDKKAIIAALDKCLVKR
ncbi:MAG: GTP-binding protein [Bacteroidaceae bacterium]|nr:GTP-binding protein [Bacteroidaceae bacterium]